jgi:hypothetical protein
MTFIKQLLLLAATVLGTVPVSAHMEGRKELNNWFAGLRNMRGDYCCLGDEATTILNADWDTKRAADGTVEYRVHLDGDWVVVPYYSVVPAPNLYGRTAVWTIYYEMQGRRVVHIACFLPGAGM